MKSIILNIALLFAIASTHYKIIKADIHSSVRDSLIKKIEIAEEDTNKVKMLSHLSLIYTRINADKGLNYAEQALELSKKISWENGKALAYKSLGENYRHLRNIDSALINLTKSLKMFEDIDLEWQVGALCSNIGMIHLEQSNFPKAKKYLERALQLSKKAGNREEIAKGYGRLGFVYEDQTDFPKALEQYKMGLEIFQELDNKSSISASFINIGNIYKNQADFTAALDYYHKAYNAVENTNDKLSISTSLSSIASIYRTQNNYKKALEYYQKSLKIDREIGDMFSIALSLGGIGGVYHMQEDFPKAIEYYKQALEIYREKKNLRAASIYLINIGQVYTHQLKFDKAMLHFEEALGISKKNGLEYLKARSLEKIGSLYLKKAESIDNQDYSESSQIDFINKENNLNKAIENLLEAKDIFVEANTMRELLLIYKFLNQAYYLKGEYKKSVDILREHNQVKDTLYSLEKVKEINNLSSVHEKKVAEKELEIQKLENIRQRNESYALYGGIGLLALVSIIIFRQRRKSEMLLLNILPAKIAKRLKKKKGQIADNIDNASTVFIDLVGFTAYSKDKNASDVLKMLNSIFSRIDNLVNKNGLEKIKTIGDGYMAASGVPEYQSDHALRAANFAIDVKNELESFNLQNGTNISARIGIESGPLVAGVIGEMKFIYDLWGDSVNTASRMESTGIPNKVHITENFKEELDKNNYKFTFSKPVELDVKGKGIMKTYYIEA
jgi:tetratricopeptide (TPR) repeat protein